MNDHTEAYVTRGIRWSNLKEFGLGYCDFGSMLWNVAIILRGLTLNIDNRNKNSILFIWYITTAILFSCYTYTYFISMIWFVFVRCIETRDVTAAMIVFSLGITSEIGVAKFINTYIYRKKVQAMIQDYVEYDSTIVPGTRFSRNLLKNLRSVKRRALIYFAVIASNGILYILKPLTLPGRQSMTNIFILFKLEPAFDTPNYELTYILSALGSTLTCLLCGSMAALFIIVAGYVEAQLLALSEELLNLWDDSEQMHQYEPFEDTTNIINEHYPEINSQIRIKLTEILKSHAKMISLLQQVETVFKTAFAFEFLILSVGLIAELLGGIENTYMQIPYAIIQVGMDCLTGQRVIDASLVFETAVYNCKWERFDAKNMRTVLLMLMNAQKTLLLSAGGITILSFETLMFVFRSIYSAFTTLQSVV